MNVTIKDFEYKAKKLLNKRYFDYFSGASMDEITLSNNTKSFDDIELLPQVFAINSKINTETTINENKFSAPIMLAPVAMQSLAYPNGELETAQACAKLNINMILSTLATTSLEDVAKKNSNNLWFQLYLLKDRAINQDLIQRAKDNNYKAIVITADSQFSGKRLRDWRNSFDLPKHLNLANLTKYNLKISKTKTNGSWLHEFINENYAQDYNWTQIAELIKQSPLPVYIKGILTPKDAKLAYDSGAYGIIVSNHGGRTVDTAISSIHALKNITQTIDPNSNIMLLDSGIRRGTDIFKAIALGAKAVLVGRPFIWGLSVGKSQGIINVIEILVNELKTTMGICGANSVDEINKEFLYFK